MGGKGGVLRHSPSSSLFPLRLPCPPARPPGIPRTPALSLPLHPKKCHAWRPSSRSNFCKELKPLAKLQKCTGSKFRLAATLTRRKGRNPTGSVWTNFVGGKPDEIQREILPLVPLATEKPFSLHFVFVLKEPQTAKLQLEGNSKKN